MKGCTSRNTNFLLKAPGDDRILKAILRNVISGSEACYAREQAVLNQSNGHSVHVGAAGLSSDCADGPGDGGAVVVDGTCLDRLSPDTYMFAGRHIVAELYGVNPDLLNDETFMTEILKHAVRLGSAELCDITAKKFTPAGVTVLALLAESHASCHTYPELGSMFVDVFTCGKCDPRVIVAHLIQQFQPTEVMADEIVRGRWQPAYFERPAPDTSAESAQVILREPLAEGVERLWTVKEVVCEAQTAHQRVLIGRTAHGVSLFCNEERQSSELSQQIYHEGQFYPGALLAQSLDRVLVIGSSEGVVCQLAAQHGAREVIHVDIDAECVRLCAEHLPFGYTPQEFASALRKEGVIKLIAEDGFDYVARSLNDGSRFDLIIMDLPDEQLDCAAQQNRLYTTAFLEKVRAILAPGGAFITQAGSCTYWRNYTLRDAWTRMNSVFETAVFYEMDEHDWAWIVGLNRICERPALDMQIKLAAMRPQPAFIDDLAIARSTILPISLRLNL